MAGDIDAVQYEFARNLKYYALGLAWGLIDIADGDYGITVVPHISPDCIDGYRDAADDSDDLDAADAAMVVA